MKLKTEECIQNSVDFLESELAVKMLEADPYWPKWNSPWWHMLVLHEMGETKRIPQSSIRKYVESLNRVPVKIFPIHPGELPENVDPFRGSPCHCQLGNVYQVLAEWGVDVDQELPWIRPWFLCYQMADGGLNCDSSAYLVKEEIPSSMVGTIAAFEAILLYTPRPWTNDEVDFLNKTAQWLLRRKLMLGSATQHNAVERVSAEQWVKLCFPRFYLYDVLRGLNAILRWGELMKRSIPSDAINDVVVMLKSQFSDGSVRIGRQSFENVKTMSPSPTGEEWVWPQPATYFPLLEHVSVVGEVSPFLTKRWEEAQDLISKVTVIGETAFYDQK